MASGSSAGELAVTAYYNDDAPLTMHEENIMVEIAGPSTEEGKTANLDLVVVLDVSDSMHGQKLDDMKQAAQFVIRKVGKLDTLTFVPFSSEAGTPSTRTPLVMSTHAKEHASDFVNALTADGATNIQDGLHTAVQILHRRTDKTGRAAGIFLMSDGEQNIGDARSVDVHDFPVFTFGFGHMHDHNLLHDIAHRSHGGTYHNTPHSDDGNSLLRFFANVLGILRDVSVLNLVVTLKPHAGATIVKVEPGNYRVTSGHESFTVNFGELARKEHRKIIVQIQLPAVPSNEEAKTAMTVECSYRLPKERESTQSLNIVMARNQNARPHLKEHTKLELTRRNHADSIRNMKRSADAKNLDEAMDELAEARNALAIIDSTQHSMDLLDAPFLELEHLEGLLESHEVYNMHGRAYMLAAILSHDRQRFAARGGAEDVMLFGLLPRMLKYMTQADEFHRNPSAAHI